MIKPVSPTHVADLLMIIADRPDNGLVTLSVGMFRELARTWLAVDGAPAGEISEAGFNEDLRGFVQLMASDATVADVPIGQRVKLVLVPEADSGGDRG